MPPRSDSWDESATVARAKRQPEEFALLYDHYVIPVYQYCYRRLRSREAAEDVTSQIFLRAFRSLDSFQGSSFRSWLFAIAHNAVVDAYRRQRDDQPLTVITDPEDDALTLEEIALARDQSSQLHRLIAQLSPAQRDVIELRLAGLTGKEIAQALNRTEGAVKSLQFRAIAQLRERYAEQTQGEKMGLSNSPSKRGMRRGAWSHAMSKMEIAGRSSKAIINALAWANLIGSRRN